MHNKKCSIGIFDSGLGGTTVLKELIKILPNENFIYYGDSKNAPYGVKTKDEIQSFGNNIVRFLLAKECKLIVIACNTSAVASLDFLKEKYKDLKFLSIIEAGAVSAARATKNNKIAVFATDFTVKSNAYKEAISKLLNETEMTQVACPEFVTIIEVGRQNTEEAELAVKKYTDRIPSDYDTLVLGCTHFPIIKNKIEKYFKASIVDPAYELALNTKKSLEENNLLNRSNEKGKIHFYVSGDVESFKKTAEEFLEMKIEAIEKV